MKCLRLTDSNYYKSRTSYVAWSECTAFHAVVRQFVHWAGRGRSQRTTHLSLIHCISRLAFAVICFFLVKIVSPCLQFLFRRADSMWPLCTNLQNLSIRSGFSVIWSPLNHLDCPPAAGVSLASARSDNDRCCFNQTWFLVDRSWNRPENYILNSTLTRYCCSCAARCAALKLNTKIF